MAGLYRMAVSAAMYKTRRTSKRPPWIRRRPLLEPESLAMGAMPTRAAISRRLSRPSSGNSAISVALATGPMPLADYSSRSRSPKCSRTWPTIWVSMSSSCALMAAMIASMLGCSPLGVICSR